MLIRESEGAHLQRPREPAHEVHDSHVAVADGPVVADNASKALPSFGDHIGILWVVFGGYILAYY